MKRRNFLQSVMISPFVVKLKTEKDTIESLCQEFGFRFIIKEEKFGNEYIIVEKKGVIRRIDLSIKNKSMPLKEQFVVESAFIDILSTV